MQTIKWNDKQEFYYICDQEKNLSIKGLTKTDK